MQLLLLISLFWFSNFLQTLRADTKNSPVCKASKSKNCLGIGIKQIMIDEKNNQGKNVFGRQLKVCSKDPITGFYRTGSCQTGPNDSGVHTVCAVLTKEFLDFSLSKGNDLLSPNPDYGFPGLKPGDRWCLCVKRWSEAAIAGKAPRVDLEATHEKTLQSVSLKELLKYKI